MCTMKEICVNCWVKEDMWTSFDSFWRPRVEIPMSEHLTSHGIQKHSARFRTRTRRQLTHTWLGKRTPRNLVPALKRGEEKTVKSFLNDSLISKVFMNGCEIASIRRKSHFNGTFHIGGQVVEEPWLMHSSIISHRVVDLEAARDLRNEEANFSNQSNFDEDYNCRFNTDMENGSENVYDLYHASTQNHPVEEPWMFESSVCVGLASAKIVAEESNKVAAEESKNEQFESQNTMLEISDQNMLGPEHLHHEDDNVLPEVPPFTVILINSSLCTMQRIAVLENDKLVELLLEPVKNNVHCDSVYLGIVTKLVPHMGGAFVNIGSPRASFMDIKPHRVPFMLPPYHGHMKEKELEESIFVKTGGQVHFPENKTFSDEVEESDEIEDDQSEDEFIDEDFESDQNRFNFDVVDAIKENMNGSVFIHEPEPGAERFSEQADGDMNQLQGKNIQQFSNIDKVIDTEGNKWTHVQKGCKILVQVVKEGLGAKGPTLTPYPVLRSRFWILISRSSTIGISKKISGSERTRLRVIAKTLQPPGFGVTVRTVASGRSIEELQKDLESLLLTWENIVEHARSAALAADEGVDGAAPVMLHRAMGQTLSVVQDYFNDKVKAMIVDSPRTYHEVTNYLQKIDPNLCDRVELYSKKTPLFDEYNIEEEINSILSKRVPLSNGGYLVIEQTEALVSIDVNGGNCMLGQGTSQDKAILGVNLVAAKQIARELRLRDIGGIIVVDFIDMIDDSNKRLVYEEVKKAVERDRSTVRVSELSRHGLMEITRKRVRPSVTFMISEPCTCCHGTGRVEALETSFSKIEHEICRHLAIFEQKADSENAKSWPRFILMVDRHMCNYLTSGKRTRLAVLSSSLKVWILLKVARGLTRGTFELKPLIENNLPKNQHQPAISVLRPTETITFAPNPKVTLLPLKWKTSRK